MVERGRGIDLARQRAFDDALESFLDRGDRGLVPRVVPRSRPSQLGHEPLDGIARPPRRELVLGDVARRVVGVRVRAHAVRDELEQRRTVTRSRAPTCRARRLDDREHVVAVDAHAGDPRRRALRGERLRRGLQPRRGGDRPPVVDARDDQRHPLHAGEVDRLVEVALRRRAVADERAHHAGVAAQLEPPREAGRVRHLRAQRDLHRERAHVVGDAAAIGMAAPVHEELLDELVAERAVPGGVAVVGDEPVGGEVEAPHDADHRGFLARERGDGREAALALQVPHPLRQPPCEQEVGHERLGEARVQCWWADVGGGLDVGHGIPAYRVIGRATWCAAPVRGGTGRGCAPARLRAPPGWWGPRRGANPRAARRTGRRGPPRTR